MNSSKIYSNLRLWLIPRRNRRTGLTLGLGLLALLACIGSPGWLVATLGLGLGWLISAYW